MISVKFECQDDDGGDEIPRSKSTLVIEAVFNDDADIKSEYAKRKLLALYDACQVFNQEIVEFGGSDK